MSYEIDLFNGTAVHPLADGARWTHVTGAGYNHWGKKTDVLNFPGGYAYIFNANGPGLPAVALDHWGDLATNAFIRADFYDGLPDGTGIAFRVVVTGGGTNWEGWRIVYEADTSTSSNLKLYKRTSGGDALQVTQAYSHPAGEPHTHIGVLLGPSTTDFYVADRQGRWTFLFGSGDTFNNTAALHGLYGESADNQKCDAFEVVNIAQESADYWLDSFDHYKATRIGGPAEAEQKYHVSSSFPHTGNPWGNEYMVAGFLPDSNGAVRIQAHVVDDPGFDQARLLVDIHNPGQKLVYGCHFNFDTYPTSDDATIIVAYSRNDNPITVNIDSSGHLYIVEGANYGTDPGTGRIVHDGPTAVIPLNTPVLIQLRAYWDLLTTMYYELWVDGMLVLSGSYATDPVRFFYRNDGYGEIGLGSIACFQVDTNVDYRCDEWYFSLGCYPWNEIVENARVVCRYPVAAGTHTAWTPVGATPNYECVNELIINCATDYVESAAMADIDTYTMSTMPTDVGIYAVQQGIAYGQVGGSPRTIAAYWVLGTDEFQGFAWAAFSSISVSPVNSSGVMIRNPWTFLPWELSEVDGLELGMRLSTGGTDVERITQVVMEVLTGYPTPPATGYTWIMMY